MLASSSQTKLWGLILPGREHSECKGPGVRRSLACLRMKRSAWHGLSEIEEAEERQEVREVQGPFPAGPDVL